MSKIKITYEHKTFNGNWILREYICADDKDYTRVMRVVEENAKDYKLVRMESVD